MATTDLDDDALLDQVLTGDGVAWMQLFSRYAPLVQRIARSNRSMGSYRAEEDDVRNVMTDVFARLRRDDYRALRSYLAWRDRSPGKQFSDWLTIVTVNLVRDYVSIKLGAPATDGSSLKQMIDTLADSLPADDAGPAVLPHITTRETAQRIGEYAREHLPPDQLDALSRWLEGLTAEEIALAMQLPDGRSADRLVRAGLARLRRQFAAERT